MGSYLLDLYESGQLKSVSGYRKEAILEFMCAVMDYRLYEEALQEYDWTLTELEGPFLNAIRKGKFDLVKLLTVYTGHSTYNYGNAIFTCLEYSARPEMLKYLTEGAYKSCIKRMQSQYDQICKTPADEVNEILELAKSVGYAFRSDTHRKLAEQHCSMLPTVVQRELGADKVKAALDSL